MNQRATPYEAGTIFHRPDTDLQPPTRQCSRGHEVPRYATNGACVICSRLAYLKTRETGPSRRQYARPMRRFTSYADAREEHEEAGGWLLVLPGPVYAVTDSENVVERARGRGWVRHCEAVGCWDEVELATNAAPASRA